MVDRADVSALLGDLSQAANPGGGWSYQAGKQTRIEPTCWALLANAATADLKVRTTSTKFLQACQRSNGSVVEDERWPANISFNALTAFTWINQPNLADENKIRSLLGWLVVEKGVQTQQSESYRQDNSLQGWSWVDATFSWVEPTAWGVLAMQKALAAGLVPEPAAHARIAEAERLLIDRCCRAGGWNFGNANVMGQDLFPHVPTTALALLALQKRRSEDAVTRSLAFLEAHCADEPSTLALGLSLICLRVYGRPVSGIENRLLSLVGPAEAKPHVPARRHIPTNLHALSVAITALSQKDDDATFRI